VPARENVSLNALRALAAVLVAVGHLRALLFVDYADASHSLANKVFYAVTGVGHPAVVVFFVLSGYWVGGAVLRSTGRGTFRWRDYLNSRMTRLWLVLLPALALTAALDAIGRRSAPDSDVYGGTNADDYHSVVPSVPSEHSGWDVLLGNAAFLSDVRVKTFGTNSPLWSVAFEFWFYIAFPLLVLAFRTGPLARRMLCAVLLVAVGVLVGVPVIELFPLWLLGAAVAHFAPRLLPPVLARVGDRLGLLQLVAAAVVFATMLVGSQVVGLVSDYLIGLAMAVLVVLLIPDVARPGVALRAVGRYAHSSYSLYAIHLPIVALITAGLIPFAADRWTPTPLHVLALVGLVALVAAIAWVFAQLTERWTDDVRQLISRHDRLRRDPHADAADGAVRQDPGA
jgi:peptidoglycan/LPS O-acetylase OafA/YrhL